MQLFQNLFRKWLKREVLVLKVNTHHKVREKDSKSTSSIFGITSKVKYTSGKKFSYTFKKKGVMVFIPRKKEHQFQLPVIFNPPARHPDSTSNVYFVKPSTSASPLSPAWSKLISGLNSRVCVPEQTPPLPHPLQSALNKVASSVFPQTF